MEEIREAGVQEDKGPRKVPQGGLTPREALDKRTHDPQEKGSVKECYQYLGFQAPLARSR